MKVFYHCVKSWTLNLRIQSECGKIRTRKNSAFGHFSHSVCNTGNETESVKIVIKKYKKHRSILRINQLKIQRNFILRL